MILLNDGLSRIAADSKRSRDFRNVTGDWWYHVADLIREAGHPNPDRIMAVVLLKFTAHLPDECIADAFFMTLEDVARDLEAGVNFVEQFDQGLITGEAVNRISIPVQTLEAFAETMKPSNNPLAKAMLREVVDKIDVSYSPARQPDEIDERDE